MISEIQEEAGPACYARTDLRLRHPVAKAKMVARLSEEAPPKIGSVAIQDVSTLDGIKYRLADDSWLLIRPSGTEPVLRVYAEAPDAAGVKALLDFGHQVAGSG